MNNGTGGCGFMASAFDFHKDLCGGLNPEIEVFFSYLSRLRTGEVKHCGSSYHKLSLPSFVPSSFPIPQSSDFFFPSSVSHPPHPLSWMLEKLNKILYKLHCPGEPSPVVMTTQHWLLSIKFWEKGKGV
ncbi:hypothetical protein RRG08_043745 [Elysia crispata]|uniref:Uncharacterized protein n=1 Tax=Elysia crispata TaxID=231223 RepID=A0AAE1DJW8_9GAST|nr:hypothetical protein RRG08_043745 [Elysia crispata]